jgi:hypothetical protein
MSAALARRELGSTGEITALGFGGAGIKPVAS